MPLGAVPGEGEITGRGHGRWAWFGTGRVAVMRDLALSEVDRDLPRAGETCKQVLALVMASRGATL